MASCSACAIVEILRHVIVVHGAAVRAAPTSNNLRAPESDQSLMLIDAGRVREIEHPGSGELHRNFSVWIIRDSLVGEAG